MLHELFDRNHKDNYDFVYLPIDSSVHTYLFRIHVTLDMLLLILCHVNTFMTFIKCSIIKNGKDSIVIKFAN